MKEVVPLIKVGVQMQSEIRSQMRGGVGNVEIMEIFTPQELKGKCRLLAKITIPVGGSIGLHEHGEEEEIYYIIQGKAKVTDAGVVRELGVGDAVLTGGGASHAIENIGAEPLVFMATILTY